MNSEGLTRDISKLSDALEGALDWVSAPENEVSVRQDRAVLERVLRGAIYDSGRLSRSARRPMCIGVFGPSQVGKSYLVSSLVAPRGAELVAQFQDGGKRHSHQFLGEINPAGGRESTGLVTRFTVHPVETPTGFPVALWLLSEIDIVKILVNSYTHDGVRSGEPVLTSEQIVVEIDRARAAAGSAALGGLREEDVWDLQEYFAKHVYAANEQTRLLGPYWDKVASIAPRCGLEARAALFALLWGKLPAFTDLYVQLAGALAQLGHAERAFCPLSSLLPRESSIIDVKTLEKVGQKTGDELVKVRGQAGGEVALRRSHIAALTAELTIVVAEQAHDFCAHTDVLDFPGYRSRKKQNLANFVSEGGAEAIAQLFLRGKVDFLFQRYTAEQELTGMVLCLPDKPLEVSTLPAVIEDWIGLTHGRTPDERQGKKPLLFFAFNFFDVHLHEKAGDSDPAQRFKNRIEASLLQPFGDTPETWPRRWTKSSSFKNCLWVRNPTVRAEHVIEFDGQNRELRILPHKTARLAELKAACLSVPEVKDHFADPERAWDEVMRLNDGGVSYLAERLAEVCRADTKPSQIAMRLSQLRVAAAGHLRPHYVPTDAEELLRERREMAQKVARGLAGARRQNAFGRMLRGLCIHQDELSNALFDARLRAFDEEPSGGAGHEDELVEQLLAARFGVSGSGTTKTNHGRTSLQRLADAAVAVWAKHMHEVAEREAFASSVGVDRSMLLQLVNELGLGAQRVRLSDAIAERADSIILPTEPAEAQTTKGALVAERLLNQFVTELRVFTGVRAANETASIDSIPAKPVPFADQYFTRWLTDFFELVDANAASADGRVHDVIQNARLGELIEQISA
jgi:hypothetical protein